MDDDQRPVDGNLWGRWVRGGNERWEVVRRSWSVFVRNTTELIDLLKIPATDLAASLRLMGDDREATAKFWEERLRLAGSTRFARSARRVGNSD